MMRIGEGYVSSAVCGGSVDSGSPGADCLNIVLPSKKVLRLARQNTLCLLPTGNVLSLKKLGHAQGTAEITYLAVRLFANESLPPGTTGPLCRWLAAETLRSSINNACPFAVPLRPQRPNTACSITGATDL
jgi:hypothetical protein